MNSRPSASKTAAWVTGALLMLGILAGVKAVPGAAAAAGEPIVVRQLEGLKRPRGVDVDAAGNIFVADTENHLIKKFDLSGKLVASWGGLGNAAGKLKYPRDLAVGPDSHIYVADTVNDRIQVFTARGTFLAAYGAGRGAGPDQFDTPKALDVAASGLIYVADTFNNRIQVLDSFGRHLFDWGRAGPGDGEFRSPTGIAISPTGAVYVADSFHDRVQVFNAAGGFIRKWGGTGAAAGQFVTPRSVAIDQSGRVYVSDSDNHRVQVFTPEGGYLQTWGSRGRGRDQFISPKGIAVDRNGLIYVTDQLNDSVPIFAALPPVAYPPDPALAHNLSVGPAAVNASLFDSQTGHNVVNLRILGKSQVLQAGFLDYFKATGGLERWGHALSEVFEESPDVLTQYFERGAIDWHLQPELGTYVIERRLAWELIGGGAGGSVDMGAEPYFLNPNEGILSGPWGHKISNLAIDGAVTGFLDFYLAHGGEQSFGLPKTDARLDTGSPGTLLLPGATPGFIRQYFQAAVLELHPGNPPFVTLANIGYALLGRVYSGNTWTNFSPFAPAPALAAGASLRAENGGRSPK